MAFITLPRCYLQVLRKMIQQVDMPGSKERSCDEHAPCGRRDELCLNPSEEELGQLGMQP